MVSRLVLYLGVGGLEDGCWVRGLGSQVLGARCWCWVWSGWALGLGFWVLGSGCRAIVLGLVLVPVHGPVLGILLGLVLRG